VRIGYARLSITRACSRYAAKMSHHSDSGSDDGGDWDSEFEDEPIVSLLAEDGRTVKSAAAAWAELRDAIGFLYAAWHNTAREETRKRRAGPPPAPCMAPPAPTLTLSPAPP
jgi:hypothetical protein